MSGNDSDALLTFVFLCLIPLVFLIYAIPSIIAFRRRHPNRFAILVINIAFGGTGIGWLGALVWALSAVHLSNKASGSNGGESGLNLFANDVESVRLVEPSIGTAGRHAKETPLTTSDALASLERLSALLAAGHLDDAEFAQLKADVLRRVSGRVSQ